MKRFSYLNKLAPYTEDYTCDQDCKASGCPGHTATFTINHAMDTFTIDWGDGDTTHLDGTQMGLLLDFVERMSNRNA